MDASSPRPRPAAARPSFARPHAAGHAASATRKLKPGQFARRHRRGPLSALLLGAGVGLALLTLAAAASWLYFQRRPLPGAPSSDAGRERARQEQVFERAGRYVQQKSYSLAIEQLASLPPSQPRDQRLAEIYMEIGGQGFKQNPPRLEAALEAYSKAVQYAPDNADDGFALAQVYYALARGVADSQTSSQNLDLARQTLQAVIDRNPQHLPAYDLLVRIAIAQRDYKLQQQTLQKIIDVSPKDSEAARNARDSLRSLGFKYDF
jgi:tetratricopeptide (TPR) repeat protein